MSAGLGGGGLQRVHQEYVLRLEVMIALCMGLEMVSLK